MDQAFHTRFEFDERPVRHDVDHFAVDAVSDRVFGFNVVPRAGRELLHAERDFLPFPVDVEDFHFDFIVDFDLVRGMADAVPTHVGDVQQTVNASQINKRTEVGDVLDDALARLSRFDLRHQFRFHLVALVLNEFAARDDDIAAGFVDFEDDAFDVVADVGSDVGRSPDVDLAGG